MIRNKVCPYCRTQLTNLKNANNGKSIEHLIPNTALTQKRGKGYGDFYACRRCNCKKSHIDYVLGVIAKAQSADITIAVSSLSNAITDKYDGRAKRFIDMISTANLEAECVSMPMPIRGIELVEYLKFLGQGQFFKIHKKPLDPKSHVMEIKFINKTVLSSLEQRYTEVHGTNPFSDLVRNPRSENINEGECVIWRKNNNYLFIFHSYTAIMIKVLKKNRKNLVKSKNSEDYLLETFES